MPNNYPFVLALVRWLRAEFYIIYWYWALSSLFQKLITHDTVRIFNNPAKSEDSTAIRYSFIAHFVTPSFYLSHGLFDFELQVTTL